MLAGALATALSPQKHVIDQAHGYYVYVCAVSHVYCAVC